ncbi:hypothetical protein [Spirulina major]|uniref:hypothetical protein n=1 Tax=Spirulina major TaxID=270636 RepID=UPI001C31D2B9|nr:hypothetical protein [Spirulina major]
MQNVTEIETQSAGQFSRPSAIVFESLAWSASSKSQQDDTEVNLALACHRCNGRRDNFTDAIDPLTQTLVPLFNPRKHQWFDHFIWSKEKTTIIGQTSIGRATIERIDMNDDRHDEGLSIQAR